MTLNHRETQKRVITKLLVANRGEIACRIMKTCRRMGIGTVAVYSQPDAVAAHVRMADEAYEIGPAPARESYLCAEKIINAALKSGAQAIHPGYGFLSEKSAFAQAVQEAGLIFVGPSPAVIHGMGDKLEAKRLARQAGVSLLPGGIDPVSSREEAYDLAKTLRFPLILKAVAGGGGKGMRLLRTIDDLDEAYDRAVSEAQSSFGDGRVFLEEFVVSPHHIEVQILADQYGSVIHLGERECSLQRRHQKVIEESPSPFPIDREALTHQAVSLAKAVGYSSAGTVEFIVAPSGEFYFLEMNTRLQVEHPVTEMVTGVDLVEEMIRVACGEPLRFTSEDIIARRRGHAIEARLYAEDADHGFLPAIGRISQFSGAEGQGIRLDQGVEAGDDISLYYDPMIAKLIAWGENRPMALERLNQALSTLILEGPITNMDFLQRLLLEPCVQQGDYSTQTIDDLVPYPDDDAQRFDQLSLDDQKLFSSVAAILYHQAAIITGAQSHTSLETEWHISFPQKESTLVKVTPSTVHTQGQESESYHLNWSPWQRTFTGSVNGKSISGRVRMSPTQITLGLFGRSITCFVLRPHVWQVTHHLKENKRQANHQVIHSPMSGILVTLPIQVGMRIMTGQPVAIIEAMKMENVLRSPHEAVIAEIFVRPGETLSKDQPILRFDIDTPIV